MLHVHSQSREQTEVAHPENRDKDDNSATTPILPVKEQYQTVVVLSINSALTPC